jgi:hypothetical protein
VSRERALVVSRVRIEKYDENMDLVDIHESKTPNISSDELNEGIRNKNIKKEPKK